MKNIAVTIFILLIIVVMGLYLVSFQVRETESALITTFGRPSGEIVEPGWYFKWPAPIQRVNKFDSRMRVYEADIEETTTKDAMPIIVNSYAVWRIAEPLKFLNAVGTVREAESKLLSHISDTQNNVVGRHAFYDFVNSDPNQIKFEQIQSEMLDSLAGPVRDAYGIEVKAVGIKQLKVSEDVSKDVFGRMSAERNYMTATTISQGQAQAKRIEDDADSKSAELLAAAEARAKALRGAGDAEAARFYKMLEADPQLAMFLRDLEALKKILEQRATIVLSAEAEPFKLLREMPDIKPKK